MPLPPPPPNPEGVGFVTATDIGDFIKVDGVCYKRIVGASGGDVVAPTYEVHADCNCDSLSVMYTECAAPSSSSSAAPSSSSSAAPSSSSSAAGATCPGCGGESNIMGSESETLEGCQAFMASYDCNTECQNAFGTNCCGTPCWYCAEVFPGAGVYVGNCCCVSI